MAIAFNTEMLRSIVQNRFGDKRVIDKLLSSWVARYERAPAPLTIRRWLHGQSSPQTPHLLWQFASTLDVDPLSIISWSSLNQDESERLLSAYQRDAWIAYRPLSYLKDFLGRQAQWPPASYQENYFRGRPWTVADFYHEATVNKGYYQLVSLKLNNKDGTFVPVAFHIAYMQQNSFGNRWLQYGVVIRSSESVQLIHINGDRQSYRPKDGSEPTFFETYFGPQPANFRVASLHAFTLELPANDRESLSTVRFE